MKTPIFIDLEKDLNYLQSNEFNLNQEDPSVFYQEDVNKQFPLDIYIDPLIAAPPFNPPFDTSKPLILAPRYYLLIKSPKDQNLPTIKINIHKSNSSLLKNKARVLLEPSLNYGINSCYKVEYWEWIPNLNLTADISKKKLFTQYWFVPLLDNNYVPYYSYVTAYNNNSNIYPYFNYPKLISEKIEVGRTIVGNIVEDYIVESKYNHIFCFPIDSIILFKEVVITDIIGHNQESKSWNFNKRLAHSILTRNIEGLDGSLTNGTTTTTVSYIAPFNSSELLIEDIIY